MQSCKQCGTPTDKPIPYCSQECDDTAATTELFNILMVKQFIPKEKQVDEMTDRSKELEEAKRYVDARLEAEKKADEKRLERIYSDGINIGCSLHGWCGNTSHCPHCVPGDKARWTLINDKWKDFRRVLNVEVMPPMFGSEAPEIDDKAEQERAEDIAFVQSVLTVLKRETQYGALVSVALDALRRIEKGEK